MSDEYLSIKQFISNHRYPITKDLLIKAERDILIKCRTEQIPITTIHHIGADQFPTRSYPRWVLEEYFMLWVK